MRASPSLLLAFLLPVTSLSGPAGAAPPNDASPRGLSTPQLLERAVARSGLSRGRADLLLAYAFTRPDRLPPPFVSKVPWDGTLPLLRLRERLETGPRTEETEEASELLAVSATTTCHDSTSGPPGETTSTHFWIQYEQPTGGLAIADYVSALDESWADEVTSFGWAAPPIKPGTPNGKYHVRVVSTLGPGLYGFVAASGTYAGIVGNNPNTPWAEPDAFASCMVLRNNYQGFPSPPLASLRSTVAHEFHHSIQYGYGAITGGNSPDDVFTEGGATWVEDEVFDEADDNHNYLWPTFTESMGSYETSLPPNQRFPYPYWVVFRAMTERYGTGVAGGGEEVMQRFWEAISQSATSNMLPSLNQALVAEGTSLADSFHAAAIAMRFNRTCDAARARPYCLEEGPAYLSNAGAPADSGTIASVGQHVTGTVRDNYALNWVLLPSSAPFSVTLRNTSAGMSAGGLLRGSLVCDTASGFRIHALPAILGPGSEAAVSGFDPTGCAATYLAITNQSETAPNPSSSSPRGYRVDTAATTTQANLTVTKVGSGSGTVTADSGGLSCGATCSVNYAEDTLVTLTAAPTPGFGHRWGGACSGGGPTCVVTMSEARSVFVTFGPLYLLTVEAEPGGTVTGPGISCPGVCSKSFVEGEFVELSASPAADHVFGGWGGACSGTGSCVVEMSQARSVSAAFPELFDLTTSTSGTGTGAVSASPPGTACGPGCREYVEGTLVTLTATAGADSLFTGWTGCASGTATCQLTMDGDRAVAAGFGAAFDIDITIGGTGAGVVSGDAQPSECSATCRQRSLEGTIVTLTAQPDGQSAFAGWSGDCTGTGSCVVSADSIVTATFDDIAPPGVATIGVPSAPFVLETGVGATWGAADGHTYEVRAHEAAFNAPFGGPVGWLNTGATGATYPGRPGTTVCFDARATDAAGNQQQAFSPLACTAVPVDDRALSRRGSWAKKTAAGAYLGTFMQSRDQGAKLTLANVRALRLAVIVTRCRGCGTIKVFLGRQLLRKIGLGASSTRRGQLVHVASFSTLRTGKVRIVVSSADGKPVRIEGLGVSAV